jgi:LmbE family N-acetylglucosaminyl deacetylase
VLATDSKGLKMKKVIVVAHPDDEILFFSSIIEKVDAVIVCFGPSGTKKVTDGRRLLQNRYPLKNIEWLNIQESNVFLSANWDHPKLTDDGILVRRDQNEYQKNFITLVELFKTKLASYDVVYTHNPWGEYGHEEHISVFKAVWSATESTKTAVYVSSYISDRSKKTFDIQKALLGSDLITGKTPKSLCESIKKLYISTDCWTWDDEYTWPDAEVFIKLGNHVLLDNKRLRSSTANPPVMFLTRSFKSSYLSRWISRLLPPTLKKHLKKILKKGR